MLDLGDLMLLIFFSTLIEFLQMLDVMVLLMLCFL